MRYGLILGILVGLVGCGEVMESMTPDAGDGGGTAGTGGSSQGGAGGGNGGSTAGAGNAGTAGSTTCEENTRIECRNVGTALVTAAYACHDEGYSEALWGTCESGTLTGYYAGLSCPFDVGITTTPGWTGPAPEATGGTIITNMGGSTSAVWTNTADTIYCCDGNTVRKIARCR